LDYPNSFLTHDKRKGLPITQVSGFKFVSLVSERLHLITELDIALLRPGLPGSIVTKGGDIDNRLKTLLDSLKVPKEAGEIPSNDLPKRGENPFFCLMEDDKLITRLNVETGQLLTRYRRDSFVKLLIHVKIKAIELTHNNFGLA